LRIFIVELILVGILVAWLFEKFPAVVDRFVPWIGLAILWHLTVEIVLDAEWSKGAARSVYRRLGNMTWIIAFCMGGLVSVGYFYSIHVGLDALASAKRQSDQEKAVSPHSPTTETHPVSDSVTVQVQPKQEKDEVSVSLTHPSPPELEIGLVLGADKGIGIDAIVDCAKPIYTCLSEDQLKDAHLDFDAGEKGWARLILRIKNVGGSELLKPVTHIESPNPISIDYAPRPDPSRLPRNVLDVYEDHSIYPFAISKAQTALPLDIVVPAAVDQFDININVFGNNMESRKRTFHFRVKRQRD
jgi:hypothetical protein